MVSTRTRRRRSRAGRRRPEQKFSRPRLGSSAGAGRANHPSQWLFTGDAQRDSEPSQLKREHPVRDPTPGRSASPSHTGSLREPSRIGRPNWATFSSSEPSPPARPWLRSSTRGPRPESISRPRRYWLIGPGQRVPPYCDAPGLSHLAVGRHRGDLAGGYLSRVVCAAGSSRGA